MATSTSTSTTEDVSWGAPGDVTDDPTVESESSDGSRPEVIAIENPESVIYRIGVTSESAGPTDATVRIWTNGELAAQAVGTVTSEAVWEAATYDGGTDDVVLAD